MHFQQHLGIVNQLMHNIKNKVEQQGKKLIDWNIQIYYGIKTGYNEAFIIDGKTKDELIVKDPKSAEILKPLLRGRDVKKYHYDFEDLWLIATFPSLNLEIENYPAINFAILWKKIRPIWRKRE